MRKKLLMIVLTAITTIWFVALYLHVQACVEAWRKGIDALFFVGPFSISAVALVASWVALAWKQFKHGEK